jgi:organic radical activating enzyme
MKLDIIRIEVCGVCQYQCVFCAHSGMLSAYKGYQLRIDELKKFIDCTKISGYSFKRLDIHGIGEPLLWDHFDEGIELLKQSGIGEKIVVTTNGLLMNKIKDRTWENIDLVEVSIYPKYPKHDMLNEKKEIYKDKIRVYPYAAFRAKPILKYHDKIPCNCLCYGPMFVKEKIFLYCGPPVFDAAKLDNADISKYSDLYVEVKPNYLENYDKTKPGNMELCNYCFANDNISLPTHPYGYTPSKLETILLSFAMDKCSGLNKFFKKRMPNVHAMFRKIRMLFWKTMML